MNLRINGDDRIFPDSTSPFTLASLVESLGMKSDRVAIELNRNIVSRESWGQTLLKDGDRLEIVHFVGGGTTPGRVGLKLQNYQITKLPSSSRHSSS
jgi:sulfur carrier protein